MREFFSLISMRGRAAPAEFYHNFSQFQVEPFD
jgi:hypothetical protein